MAVVEFLRWMVPALVFGAATGAVLTQRTTALPKSIPEPPADPAQSMSQSAESSCSCGSAMARNVAERFSASGNCLPSGISESLGQGTVAVFYARDAEAKERQLTFTARFATSPGDEWVLSSRKSDDEAYATASYAWRAGLLEQVRGTPCGVTDIERDARESVRNLAMLRDTAWAQWPCGEVRLVGGTPYRLVMATMGGSYALLRQDLCRADGDVITPCGDEIDEFRLLLSEDGSCNEISRTRRLPSGRGSVIQTLRIEPDSP
jgi:hypothetical protein